MIEIINERTSCILTVTFKDEDGDLVIPDSGTYRIDTQDTAVTPSTDFIPEDSTHEIVITGEENRIISTDCKEEIRIVTVTWVKGDVQGSGEYRYRIKNLAMLS